MIGSLRFLTIIEYEFTDINSNCIVFLGDLHDWENLLHLSYQLAQLRPDLYIYFRPHPKTIHLIDKRSYVLPTYSIDLSNQPIVPYFQHLKPLISFIGPSGVSIELSMLKIPFRVISNSSIDFFNNSPMLFFGDHILSIKNNPQTLSDYISSDFTSELITSNLNESRLHISCCGSEASARFSNILLV